MFCQRCGKDIEEDTKFCGYCGYELREDEVGVLKVENMERNLTKSPKLGVFGWGLAGGFIMGKIPGSTRGSAGVALLFLGVLRYLGDPGMRPLVLVFLTIAALLILSGYFPHRSRTLL